MKKSSVFIYMLIILGIYGNVSAQITTTSTPDTTTIPSDPVVINIGNGSGLPGSHDRQVEVLLDNPVNKVNGVQMYICDVDDYLMCSSLELTERSEGAVYSISELDNGCCHVLLVDNVPPYQLIQEGSGPIAIVRFDVSTSAPVGGCRTLNPESVEVLDEFNAPMYVTSTLGDFCFTSGNSSIPTLSEWGIIIFMTIILGIGVTILLRRKEV